MLQRRQLVRLALPAILVAVGACGGSAQGEDQKSAGSDKTSTTDGPLAAIFGGSESPAESRRKQLKQEELVAQCMKEKGWEYNPVDYSAQFDDSGGNEDANLSPEEFGKKYAYGVAHNYELYELPNLSGQATADTGIDAGASDGASTDSFVDPNQEYVTGLSESEQQQYYEDLQGKPQEAPTDDTAVFVPPPLEEQGCYGLASKEVYGESPFQDPEISQRLDELFTNLEDDPEIKTANKKWLECVKATDSSYELTSPNDTYSYFEKVKAELAGQQIVPLDPATGSPQGGEPGEMWNSTQNADGTGWAFIGEPKPLDAQAIDQLRTDEFKLYGVDQKCQKKVGITKIRKRVEQELADQILTEFPQLKKDG